MAPNTPKNNRPSYVDNIEKLVEGFTKHAADVPQLVLGGVTHTNADIVSKMQARVVVSKTVDTTHATWQSALTADKAATEDLRSLLSTVRQALLAMFAGKAEALADFGLTMRKTAVISPDTRVAAAIKAKATRAVRGTMGKKQKAKLVANIKVTPATGVEIKGVPVMAPDAPAAPAAAPAPVPAATPVTHS